MSNWQKIGAGYELEFFDDSKVYLMRETNRHPPLVKMLEEDNLDGEQDWPDRLATIATYCGEVLDGSYTPHELDRLASHLYHKLQRVRFNT